MRPLAQAVDAAVILVRNHFAELGGLDFVLVAMDDDDVEGQIIGADRYDVGANASAELLAVLPRIAAGPTPPIQAVPGDGLAQALDAAVPLARKHFKEFGRIDFVLIAMNASDIEWRIAAADQCEAGVNALFWLQAEEPRLRSGSVQ
jgi:hypothetical protein